MSNNQKKVTIFRTAARLAALSALAAGLIALIPAALFFADGFVAILAAGIIVAVIVFLVVYVAGYLLLRKPLHRLHSLIRDSYKNYDPYLESEETVHRDELAVMLEDAKRGKKAIHQEFERLDRTENYRKEFIGDLSHELKTPIFSVQGYLETLENGALEDPAVNRQFLRKAIKNVDRLTVLARDLTEISRLETGELKPEIKVIPLNVVIQDVTEALHYKTKNSGIRIHYKPEDPNAFVLADRNQLRQVLINLIDNAIKYNKPDGEVFIEHRTCEKDPARFTVWVRDTGIGIYRKDIPRVTERFFRVDKSRSREQGGTGLGLAIVKHIVESHGEKLMIESEPGKGSTFGFTIRNADFHSE